MFISKEKKLWRAIDSANIEKMEKLISKGANIGWINSDSYHSTYLHLSVKKQNIQICQKLIDLFHENNISEYIDKEDGNKQTPLFFAVTRGGDKGLRDDLDFIITKLLLENNINVNHSDLQGRTPLHKACLSGNLKVVKLLIQHGADVNINTCNDLSYGPTPLYSAVKSNNLDLVKYLLNNGADYNIKNDWGEKAIDIAISLNLNEIVEYMRYFSDNNGVDSDYYVNSKISDEENKDSSKFNDDNDSKNNTNENSKENDRYEQDINNIPIVTAQLVIDDNNYNVQPSAPLRDVIDNDKK